MIVLIKLSFYHFSAVSLHQIVLLHIVSSSFQILPSKRLHMNQCHISNSILFVICLIFLLNLNILVLINKTQNFVNLVVAKASKSELVFKYLILHKFKVFTQANHEQIFNFLGLLLTLLIIILFFEHPYFNLNFLIFLKVFRLRLKSIL